jgi:hypothetical protein
MLEETVNAPEKFRRPTGQGRGLEGAATPSTSWTPGFAAIESTRRMTVRDTIDRAATPGPPKPAAGSGRRRGPENAARTGEASRTRSRVRGSPC